MSSLKKKAPKKNTALQEKIRKEKQRTVLITVGIIVCAVLIAAVVISAVIDGGRNADDASEAESSAASASSDGDAGSAESAAEDLAVSADDITVSYYADIAVKDYGTITVALDAEEAPVTVANFVKLAREGFYDGLTFHRIMDGFMIQGGDPNGDGTGGSDETIKGEFSQNGVENNISHVRGAISMARSSSYDSASSQFFIVQSDSTFLDGQYAGFGFVTEGMDIVDRIAEDAEPTDDNGTIPSDEQPVIESITIRDVSDSLSESAAESFPQAAE